MKKARQREELRELDVVHLEHNGNEEGAVLQRLRPIQYRALDIAQLYGQWPDGRSVKTTVYVVGSCK